MLKISRLHKSNSAKMEREGVLCQMTSQSPNLNPIEMIWDELYWSVKEKQ